MYLHCIQSAISSIIYIYIYIYSVLEIKSTSCNHTICVACWTIWSLIKDSSHTFICICNTYLLAGEPTTRSGKNTGIACLDVLFWVELLLPHIDVHNKSQLMMWIMSFMPGIHTMLINIISSFPICKFQWPKIMINPKQFVLGMTHPGSFFFCFALVAHKQLS